MSGRGICRAVASGYRPPAERSVSENHRIAIFDFQKANVRTLVLDKHRLFEAFGARGYAVASRYVAIRSARSIEAQACRAASRRPAASVGVAACRAGRRWGWPIE